MLIIATSEKTVILFEEISSSEAETESFVGATGTDIAISHHLTSAPEEQVVVERYKESPSGLPEQLICGNRRVSDEEAGTGVDSEEVDVDNVGSAPALAISGFESEVFTFSEIVRGK